MDAKQFSDRLKQFQLKLWELPKVDSEATMRKSSIVESTTEKVVEGLQFFMMMYVLQKMALQDPAEVVQMFKSYEELAVKEVSSQVDAIDEFEQANADNPMFTLIKSLMPSLDIESVEGEYLQQIHRVSNLHREFLGLPTDADALGK